MILVELSIHKARSNSQLTKKRKNFLRDLILTVYIIKNKIVIVSYYEKEIEKLRSDTDDQTLYF